MDPFSWAMLIMSALSTVNAMTSGSEQNTETDAAATGGPDLTEKPSAIGAPDTGLGGIEQILAMIPDMGGAQAATQNAAAQVQPTPVEAPAAVPAPTADTPATETAPAPSVGEVLMQVPAALAQAGDLLGMNQSNTRTQRPAPAAGGSAGGVVGQFGRQMGQSPNIGQLLASLPGIR